MIAFTIQYLSRMKDSGADDGAAKKIMAYKHSASKLCTLALSTGTPQPKEHVIDTTVVLFNLDVSTRKMLQVADPERLTPDTVFYGCRGSMERASHRCTTKN